jgi:hypothetical protein
MNGYFVNKAVIAVLEESMRCSPPKLVTLQVGSAGLSITSKASAS